MVRKGERERLRYLKPGLTTQTTNEGKQMLIVKISDKTTVAPRKINDTFTVKEINTLGFKYNQDNQHTGTELTRFSIPENQQVPKPGYYLLSYEPRVNSYGSLEASRTLIMTEQSQFKEPAPLS